MLYKGDGVLCVVIAGVRVVSYLVVTQRERDAERGGRVGLCLSFDGRSALLKSGQIRVMLVLVKKSRAALSLVLVEAEKLRR